MLPFFADLVTSTDEARREFETDPAILDAVAHGLPLARYRNLLLELYHLVWHFNPVCAAAASRIRDEEKAARYFLYEHMHEESGHEAWVLQDLEAVGVDAATTTSHEAAASTLALTGYNYWSAERRNPMSVFGMMYAMEVIASVYGGTFSSAIKESLLLEEDRGVSFISSHALMDKEHMLGLRKILNTVSDPSSRQAIIESTKVNFRQLTEIFSKV